MSGIITINEGTKLVYPSFRNVTNRRISLASATNLILQEAEYLAQTVDSSTVWKTKKDKERIKRLYDYLIFHTQRYYKEYEFTKKYIDSDRDEAASPKIVSALKATLPEVRVRNPGLDIIALIRVKAWRQFFVKLITNIENEDYDKLDAYYDIYAARIVIPAEPIAVAVNDEKCRTILDDWGVPVMKYIDSEEALQQCYDVANSICLLLEERGHKPLDAKFKKPVSEKIFSRYRTCIKDYIKSPKSNGYSSLHILYNLILEDGSEIPVEIQVRTAVMDYDAEDLLIDIGNDNNADTLSHNQYKKNRIRLGLNPNQIKIIGYRAECKNGLIVKEQDLIGFNKPIFL